MSAALRLLMTALSPGSSPLRLYGMSPQSAKLKPASAAFAPGGEEAQPADVASTAAAIKVRARRVDWRMVGSCGAKAGEYPQSRARSHAPAKAVAWVGPPLSRA